MQAKKNSVEAEFFCERQMRISGSSLASTSGKLFRRKSS